MSFLNMMMDEINIEDGKFRLKQDQFILYSSNLNHSITKNENKDF